MQSELAIACLRSRIVSNERTFETWNPETMYTPHMVPTAYTQQGICLFDNAVFHHLLGENRIAKGLFAQSAGLLKEGALRSEPPKLVTLTSALEAALLAHDWEAAAQMANEFSKCPGHDLVRDRLAYSLALSLLVLKQDADVQSQIDQAMAVDAKKAWYPGIGRLLVSVLSQDSSGFVEEAKIILEVHHRRARHKNSFIYSSSIAFICVPVTVLGIIAIQRGMDIADGITNRHATIPMSLAYISEYKGEPIKKGSTVDVEVDYVPKAFLISGVEKDLAT
jgi:hypothetical protein